MAGLVGLNAVIGGWTPARIESLEEAAERLAEDVIGFHASEGVVAADGRAALVLDRDQPRLGIVVARRDRLVCRALPAGGLRSVEADARDSLSLDLRLDDDTLSRVGVRFADAPQAETWRRRLERFTGGPRDA